MSATTFIQDLKKSLSPTSREYFSRLEKRPEVQKILLADENEQLAVRADLVALIPSTWAKFEKPLAASVKRREEILKRMREHEQAGRELEAENVASFSELCSLQFQRDNVISRTEMELRNDADTRIAAAIGQLQDLRTNGLTRSFRHGALAVAVNESKTWSNHSEGVAAGAVIDAAITSCLSMQLEALSSEAVEKRLTALFAKVDIACAGIELRGPRLRDGAVVEGARFGDRSAQQGEAK